METGTCDDQLLNNFFIPIILIYHFFCPYFRCTKHDSQHPDAFISPNYNSLGVTGNGIVVNYNYVNAPSKSRFRAHKSLCAEVHNNPIRKYSYSHQKKKKLKIKN